MSQNEEILKHLQEIGCITQWEAIRLYRITRLSARIKDLRSMGHNISSTNVYGKDCNGRPQHWTSYRLEE